MDEPKSDCGHIIEVQAGAPTAESGSGSVGSKACAGATCGFTDFTNSSKGAQHQSASIKKLLIAVGLCIVFMIVEIGWD